VVHRDEDDDGEIAYSFTPVAFMVRENPFERFAPPDADSPESFVEPEKH
jgi:hypothetical protein